MSNEYNYNVVEANIKKIRSGDTVMINGVMKTVCAKDIKYCSFMGTTLFGSSYRSGTEPVEKVVFIQP